MFSKKKNTDESLTAACNTLNAAGEFEVGDIVTLKEGLGSLWKRPEPGQHVIITRVLEQPLTDITRPGLPFYGVVYDVTFGMEDDDGDFVEHAFDSRRLTHVKP